MYRMLSYLSRKCACKCACCAAAAPHATPLPAASWARPLQVTFRELKKSEEQQYLLAPPKPRVMV